MNWKNEATNDLTTYTRKKESLENIKKQIQALNMQFTAVKGGMSDTAPVMGGGSKYEDRLLDNVVKRDVSNVLLLLFKLNMKEVKL